MKWYIGAMLENYSRLGAMISATDRHVMSIALCSSGYMGRSGETISEINKIKVLTDKKIRLLKIMALVNEVVTALEYKYKQAAKFRFIRAMTVEDTAAKLDVSVRTVYRILDCLPNECEKIMAAMGYDMARIIKEFGVEEWLEGGAAKIMKERLKKDAVAVVAVKPVKGCAPQGRRDVLESVAFVR